MELSEKINCPTYKHLGHTLNKSSYDFVLCVILLDMVPQHWKSTYWISASKVVITNWKKLVKKQPN